MAGSIPFVPGSQNTSQRAELTACIHALMVFPMAAGELEEDMDLDEPVSEFVIKFDSEYVVRGVTGGATQVEKEWREEFKRSADSQ